MFATVVAAASLVMTGCEEDTVAPPAKGSTAFAFVTTTDFQTGSSSVIWRDGKYTTDQSIASVHSDAVARYFGGLIYVVNRFGGDNIQVLDPSNSFGAVRQFSVGNGSDPHDILVIDETKAYVTRYNSTELWIINPSTGVHTATIDLSSLADGDGTPEMDRLLRIGDRVFVSIQRLDRNTQLWDPVGESYVGVVDVVADTLVDADATTAGIQPIVAIGFNPFSTMDIDPASGRLCVAMVGNWGVADGGVEMINPTTLRSEGFVFAEAKVSGDITDVVMVSAEKGFVIYSDASFNNVLQGFSPLNGEKTNFSFAPGGFVLQDIALAPTGELFLTDRTATKPGIRIYDVATDTEITTDPIDVGLPPFAITFGAAPQP
jgi:DNA-binding beta-propeller fold protein YncE